MKITGRSSSITNAFVNSIIPVIQPTNDEVRKALSVLSMDHESYCCAYCGDAASEWDHLMPLVINKRPTGYISEIANLVPSCGKCNQSKGNKPWAEWVEGGVKLSPRSRGISDLDIRIKRLKDYEKLAQPRKIDFESIVDKGVWQEHWHNCNVIHEKMKHAQLLADRIKFEIAQGENDD